MVAVKLTIKEATRPIEPALLYSIETPENKKPAFGAFAREPGQNRNSPPGGLEFKYARVA